MDPSLLLGRIDWPLVLLATAVSFPLGALWHSRLLFGGPWSAEVHPDHPKTKANAARIFGLSALLHFVALAGLSALVGKDATLAGGLATGAAVSLAFVATTLGVTYIFANRSMKLFLIDAGFYLALFTLAGVLFAL